MRSFWANSRRKSTATNSTQKKSPDRSQGLRHLLFLRLALRRVRTSAAAAGTAAARTTAAGAAGAASVVGRAAAAGAAGVGAGTSRAAHTQVGVGAAAPSVR